MKALQRHRFLLLAALAIVLLPMALRSGSLGTEVLVYGLAALGCNLLLGYTGLLSFGQGIFFGLGSYAVGILTTRAGLPILPSVLLAIVTGAAAATLVGAFAIRQRGAYFVMLTLAFAQMFYFLAYSLPDLTGGDNGLLNVPMPSLGLLARLGIPPQSPWQFYAITAAVFLAVFWLLERVTASVFGRTLLAIRENEARALAIGYDTRHFKLAAFAMSGAVTALAGALHAMMTGIAPLSDIGYHTSEMILVMTVIGGTGNLFASLLGAAFYVLMSDWLSTLWPRWLLLLGLALIAVSLFLHQGLWGLGDRLAGLLRGRRAPAPEHPT